MTEETSATIKILDRIGNIFAETIWMIHTDGTIIPVWLEGEEFRFGSRAFGSRTGFEFLEELASVFPSITDKLAKPV